MSIFRAIAVVGAIATGALGFSQTDALATPLASARHARGEIANPASSARPIIGDGRIMCNTAGYGYGYGYRPALSQIRRPAGCVPDGFRVVRTPYGRIVRRPVQVCTRRY